MKLVNSVALKQEIANVMPSRTEVFLVIDAMPDAIVRCKDCKHANYCSIHESKFSDDWFCADGIAKDINVHNKEGR